MHSKVFKKIKFSIFFNKFVNLIKTLLIFLLTLKQINRKKSHDFEFNLSINECLYFSSFYLLMSFSTIL